MAVGSRHVTGKTALADIDDGPLGRLMRRDPRTQGLPRGGVRLGLSQGFFCMSQQVCAAPVRSPWAPRQAAPRAHADWRQGDPAHPAQAFQGRSSGPARDGKRAARVSRSSEPDWRCQPKAARPLLKRSAFRALEPQGYDGETKLSKSYTNVISIQARGYTSRLPDMHQVKAEAF